MSDASSVYPIRKRFAPELRAFIRSLGQISSFGEVIGPKSPSRGMTIESAARNYAATRQSPVVLTAEKAWRGWKLRRIRDIECTPNAGRESSSGQNRSQQRVSPFQEICTPIHRRMNDDRRMTTSIAASPSNGAQSSQRNDNSDKSIWQS